MCPMDSLPDRKRAVHLFERYANLTTDLDLEILPRISFRFLDGMF